MIGKIKIYIKSIGVFGFFRASQQVINHLYLRLMRRFSRSQRLIAQRIHNYRMLLDIKDPGISKVLFIHKTREQQSKYILERHKPIIVMSVHPRHLNLLGESIGSLKILITSLGYKILDMDRKITSDLRLKEYLLEPK